MTARFRWTDAEVQNALGVASVGALSADGFSDISTDTRSLSPGALFVALEGERFDGHAFLDAAAAAGAAGAVVREGAVPPGSTSLPFYPVADTLVALGALARHRRLALPARVVGITGSSGKTAVKDLVRGALADSHRVHATKGNLNNRIGVPLTLLSAPEDTEFAVVEMGTSEPGEIAALAAIAVPDAVIITTIAEAHLEGLGSLQGVLEEKLDLLRGIRNGGPAVVGDEPEILPRRAREIKADVRVAGLSPRADRGHRGELLGMESNGCYRFRLGDAQLTAPLPGRHGVRNTLLALALADGLHLDRASAVRGLGTVKTGALRGEVRSIGSATLILDCYNANPQSTRGAVELLSEFHAKGPRVAILGSMLELGPESELLHEEVLREALLSQVELVVAVGLFARAAGSLPTSEWGPTLISVPTPEEAFDALLPHLNGGELILLKGSRGMALERLVPQLEAHFGAAAAAGGN